MSFIELLKKRHSVRKFSNQKVSREEESILLESIRLAPTAANFQPQRVIIIKEEDEMKKLDSVTKAHFNAPLIFIVGYDKNISWKRGFDNIDIGRDDACCAITQLMLTATDLNLGTTWVANFDPKVLKTVFNIPDNIEIVAIIPIGKPANDSEPSPKHYQRNETDQFIVNI